MESLKDIKDKMNDKCMLINYIYADIGMVPDKGVAKSRIAILCNEDKQEYLNRIKKWQKEFVSEVEYKLEHEGEIGSEVRDRLWKELWSDLEPNRDKSLLKDIPKLDVQFIDKCGIAGIEGMVIKIEEEELEKETNEGCILVNYMHADFGDEIQLSHEDKERLSYPCPVKDYSIKNKVAVLCGEDKQKYLGRVKKGLQEIPIERDNRCMHDRGGFKEWIESLWNSLEPNKNLIEGIPTLDVHYMILDEDSLDALRIEVKGELSHRWTYPDYPHQ